MTGCCIALTTPVWTIRVAACLCARNLETQVFSIAGWALGLIFQGWNVYGPGARPISEAEIQRGSDRLRR
jgi:hypothetical protein